MGLTPKVSIIGGGNVGTRFAYASIINGLAREMVLVDVNQERAEGEIMDLSHGAPYVSPVQLRVGGYADVKDSDLVVVTAGRKQNPGQTRLELARANVELFREMIPQLVKYAPEAVYLIVSNPVDVLAYAAFRFSGLPARQVLGSGTVLDSARLRYLLSRHCEIDARNVHAYILGEHGDSEFPVWSKVMIGGILLNEFCPFCEKCSSCHREEEMDKLFGQVRDSAYRIIEKKGETSFGVGLALVRICEAVLNNESSILPVSSLIEDYLGVNDIYLSLPSVVNRIGVSKVLKVDLNPEEREWFVKSAQAVKKVIRETGLA